MTRTANFRVLLPVGLIVTAGFVLVLAVAGLQILRSPDAGPGSVERRRAVGGVAMSSPVDPDAKFYWEMDHTPRSLIPLRDLVSGGPPPDGIPSIDAPLFESVAQANTWLSGREPVVALMIDGVARAYPVQILTWHEIVNDVVAGAPVTVSFCPLCNSAIVYDRRAGDKVLDFGTSGLLLHSDLVMYDRQTKSLWPQIEGRAVVGPMIGTELTMRPSQMLSWSEWKTAHPDGRVLSRPAGMQRPYGRNPYPGYDREGDPGLLRGKTDGRLSAKERVVAVEIGGVAAAYPFRALADRAPAAVHDTVGGTEIVILFKEGTASALDRAELARGRDVGAGGVFNPSIDGRVLTLRADGTSFVDEQTGSRWSLSGIATDGPLAGRRLEPVPHVNTFWFAWAAFKPDTAIRLG